MVLAFDIFHPRSVCTSHVNICPELKMEKICLLSWNENSFIHILVSRLFIAPKFADENKMTVYVTFYCLQWIKTHEIFLCRNDTEKQEFQITPRKYTDNNISECAEAT
jgi:hypothetical protein